MFVCALLQCKMYSSYANEPVNYMYELHHGLHYTLYCVVYNIFYSNTNEYTVCVQPLKQNFLN